MNKKLKLGKKTVSLLLSALMSLGAFCGIPLSAAAEENNIAQGEEISGAALNEIDDYGRNKGVPAIAADGDATSPFYYEVKRNGTIRIRSYNGDDKDTMTDLVIPAEIDGKSVTTIGLQAFENYTNLKSVTIPDSVVSIEFSAFLDCTSLKSVIIPKSVADIGDHAFGYCNAHMDEDNNHVCDKVDGFKITGYKNSAAYAYARDENFEFVSLGEADHSFGYYILEDGTLGLTDYYGDDKKTMTKLDIPAEIDGKKVTAIENRAFSGCTSLTNVTIPEGVTGIYYHAFYNCPNLKSVTIPKSVSRIDNEAFGYYGEEETYDAEKIDGFTITGYTYSAAYSYAHDSGFEFVSLGEVRPFTYDTIDDGTIYITGYNGDASEVDIPAKIDGKRVTEIGGSSFKNCTSLINVTIPDSVTIIGDSAFENCTSLTSVTIPEDVTYIGRSAFKNCTNLISVDIPEGVTEIEYSTFSDCTSLTSVTIPESVTVIGVAAFEGCTSLKTVTIPESVTDIENFAFSNCTSLISVTIPESVTDIGDSAFSDCTSLTSVIISKSVTDIGKSTFEGCTSLTRVTIPENVTEIRGGAFSDCTSLTSVTISDGVTYIGNEAFYNCPNLKAVTIPKSVIDIEWEAFGYCTGYHDENDNYVGYKVENFTITGYTNSAAYAYARDNDFKFISLGEVNPCAYRELNDGTLEIVAYYGDETEVDIPAKIDGKSVVGIDYEAFSNCTSLTSVNISEGVTYIGSFAFSNCTSLTSVTIPEGIISIYFNTFYNCSSLKTVTIPKSVTHIDSGNFGYYYDEKTGKYNNKIDGFKIIGYKNSAAYAYARDNEFEFESLGEVNPLACNELEDGTLELFAYYGDDRETMTKLDIPAEIDGKSVIEIEQLAF